MSEVQDGPRGGCVLHFLFCPFVAMTRRSRFRFSFDPGFLVVLVICLLAVWPLLSRVSLPEGTDAELHIFRLHELSLLIRGGEFYPRWAPNFYHGYGYPIFNYYAPLTYYLALPFELLPAIDAVAASKIVLVGGMLLAGLGIYGYVRDNWGRRAGYVAAALYVYSPYIQYIDPHMRGALPEAFSFGLFPLALWAMDRLRRRPAAGPWLASVIAIAAVILSHNLMGLFFYGLLAAWVAWQGLLLRRQPGTGGNGRPAFLRLAAAMLVGLGLAAVYWLPVILERNAVTLSTLIGSGDNYDFRTHFLSLGELLAFSRMPDWGATQSPFLFNLGVVQWALALVGVVMLAARRVRQPAQLAFSVLAGVAVLLLMLSVSRPAWELLPFMAFFQFPWRLLGAAAALLAIVGAAGVEALATQIERPNGDRSAGLDNSEEGGRARPARQAWAVWFYAAAVVLPMMLGLPLSQPTPWEPFGEVNTLRMSLIENSGRWLGTTSTADYVPATVIVLPPRRGSVVEPIGRGLPPDRVNHEAMPDGAVVVAETVRPLLTRYQVSAPKQFRLRLYQFDFPGWRVTIDGEPAVTELAEPEGFIVVLIPQGDHIVEVEFGSTPPRTLAWFITILAAALAGFGAWRLRITGIAGSTPAPSAFAPPVRSDWPILLAVGGLTALAILIEPLGLFHANSRGRELDIPATESYVNFGDQIDLIGFDASHQEAAPGEPIDLTLYWRAARDLDIAYQVFVHILDESGEPVAQSDKLNPGEFPTHRWPLDKYVPDGHSITLPSDLPPGEYQVAVGLWVQGEGWRLPVFDEQGTAVDDRAVLFNLRVE
jgi:hypothetical protein